MWLLLSFKFIICCQSLFYVGATVAVVTNDDSECREPIGNWCRLTSEWATNRPLARTDIAVASYKRINNASSPGLTRILVHGGLSRNDEPMTDSWIYCAGTNSWIPAFLPRIPNESDLVFDPASDSLTTICQTQIILLRQRKNDTWLFDGTREEWARVSASSPPLPRAGYSVSAVSNKITSCRCKESLLLYGGLSSYDNYYNEMWELRCVDDHDIMRFRWINVTQDPSSSSSSSSLWPPKLIYHTSFAIQKNMYIVNGYVPTSYYLYKSSKDIWQFDVEASTWTLHDMIPFVNPISLDVAVFLKQIGVLMLLGRETVTFYDAANKKSVTSKFHSNEGLGWAKNYITSYGRMVHNAMGVDGNEDVFVMGPANNSRKLAVWKINKSQFEMVKARSAGTKNITMVISPHFKEPPKRFPGPPYEFQNGRSWARKTFVGDYLFVSNPGNFEFWQLDIKSSMWTLYEHDTQPDFDDAAVAALGKNHLAAFGRGKEIKASKYELWIYTVSQRLWTNQVQQSDLRPPNRVYSTLTLIQNESLILCGSLKDPTELWVLTVEVSAMRAIWHMPIGHGNKIILSFLPMEAYSQSVLEMHAAVANDTFYLFGGLPNNGTCNLNVFHVNVEESSAWWQFSKLRTARCVQNSAAIGRHVFYSGISRAFLGLIPPPDGTYSDGNLWTIDLLSGKQEVATTNDKFHPLDFLAAYKEEVVTWRLYTNYDGTTSWSFYTFKPGCSPGTYSKDFKIYPCRPCPRGWYSNRPGATKCEKCPGELTTTYNGSKLKENCTCDEHTCHHGECILLSDYTTRCVCSSGFTGNNCQYPTKFLIGSGAATLILVVIAFIYCADRIRRHRKVASKRDKQLQETINVLDKAEQTLTQLSSIWSVENKEIDLEKVIGHGSFGHVWSAQYRDQIVAIKVLKIKAHDCTNEQLKEFNDESELLRSVFHANIVRFIGTGKNAEGKPFIVLEYMERGSVRQELDTNYAHTPMELKLQVKWAMDAAKGMRHLHSIGRMHRDLKCDNLLINDRGVVKVADLGCTKLVPKIAEGHQRGTRAVGTALFRAPEIIRGRDYDSSVDVYSYGITLWEIQTAKNPYVDQLQLGVTVRDILDRVVGEEFRPEFPAYCDKDMIELTKSCWQMSPFRRPTFDEIVLKLEAICFRDQIGKIITYTKNI